MTSLARDQGTLIAAIKFDANADSLVQTAIQMAIAGQSPLHLVHIFTLTSASSPAAGGGLDFQAAVESCKQKLKALATKHASGGENVHCSVIVGEFPDALIEMAAIKQAPLVLAAAASPTDPKDLRPRLQKTYRLMDRSAIPVLVIPDAQHHLPIGKRPLRIMIADDMTDASLPTLGAAAVLADLLRSPLSVTHVHVMPGDSPLKGGGGAIEPRMWPGIAAEERLINDHQSHLLDRLGKRARHLKSTLSSWQGSYMAELWEGQVPAAIGRASQVHAADITIFGRHRFMHPQKWGLGKMPCTSMLNVEGAVLVAPD